MSGSHQLLRFCSILVLLLSGVIFRSNAQVETVSPEEKDYKNILSIVPQYAFYHGIRFDYERKLGNKDLWLVFAPQYYSDYRGYNSWNSGPYLDYYELNGTGLNTYIRAIAFKSQKLNRASDMPRQILYFAGGPSFQYFTLKGYEEVPTPVIIDGLTYYQFKLEEVKKPIYRVGLSANAGVQFIFDRFVLDMYLGLAFKYAMDDNGQRIDAPYAEWIDPYYSGVLLDGGLKLGVVF